LGFKKSHFRYFLLLVVILAFISLLFEPESQTSVSWGHQPQAQPHDGFHHFLDCAIVSVKRLKSNDPAAIDTNMVNGTGFVFAPGYVMTAYHVVEGYDSLGYVYVYIIDEWRLAKVVKTTPMKKFNTVIRSPLTVYSRRIYDGDAAILEVDTEGLPTLIFSDEKSSFGDSLYWYRFSGENKFFGTFEKAEQDTIRRSFSISIFWAEVQAIGEFVVINGYVVKGSSGSPVLNNKGDVTAMVVRMRGLNITKAISVSDLKKFVTSFIKERDLKKQD